MITELIKKGKKMLSYLKCIDEKRSDMLELQMKEMKKDRVQQQALAEERRKHYEETIAAAATHEKEVVASLKQRIDTLEQELLKTKSNEKTFKEKGKKEHVEKSVLKKEVLRQRRVSDIREAELEQLKNQVTLMSSRLQETEGKLMAANNERASVSAFVEVRRPSTDTNDLSAGLLSVDKDAVGESDCCETCTVQ